jgi:site-specific DNA recombinase
VKRAVILLRVSGEGQTKRAGADEGYSFEYQRDRCYGEAARREAEVVKQFVAPAESASNGMYRTLREALDFVREDGNIDYFIVYMLDRFVRDELTQFQTYAELQAVNTQLVSASEVIDNTPAGLMNMGMLTVVNAYRSRNDAIKIKDGLRKKAELGGMPGRARIGYLNKQRWDGKNDIRWVEVDPERAPFITRAFKLYESGNWGTNDLADKLYEDGFRTRPTKKRPAGKIKGKRLHEILRDPVYIGVVTWQGIKYEGTHPHLIDKVTFDRVQALLTAKNHAGEKHRRHPHYLKGTIYCGRCKRRMMFTRSRGNGGVYEYFMCAGRHSDRSGCPQPFLRTEDVEDAVARYYGRVVTQRVKQITRLRKHLIVGFEGVTEQREAAVAAARRELDKAEAERRKLLQLSYDGKMPDDLFGEEQARLLGEIERARETLDASTVKREELAKALDLALEAAIDAELTYALADPVLRRQLNQAFFVRIFVSDGEVVGAELAEPYAALLRPDLPSLVENPAPRQGRKKWLGVRKDVLVELAGLEPATSWVRSRRSSS